MYFQKTLTTFRLKSLEVSSIYPFVGLEQGNCNTLAAMLFLPGKRDEKEEEGKEHYFFFSSSSLHSFRLKEMKWRRREMNYAVSNFLIVRSKHFRTKHSQL